jgi:hypothetical protein
MPSASISGSTGGDLKPRFSSSKFDINSSQDLMDVLPTARHLFIHLFAGVDGATEALDQLAPDLSASFQVLHLWFESDPFCQTVLRSRADQWHRLVNLTDSAGVCSSWQVSTFRGHNCWISLSGFFEGKEERSRDR